MKKTIQWLMDSSTDEQILNVETKNSKANEGIDDSALPSGFLFFCNAVSDHNNSRKNMLPNLHHLQINPK